MAKTEIRGTQILDGSITKVDLNTTSTGEAVVTKVVEGKNVNLSSTGVDHGTGDVTINVNSSLRVSELVTDTTDGADNESIAISGGGAVSTSRGGYMQIFGNEHATNAGKLSLFAGDVAGGDIVFRTGNAVTKMSIKYDGSYTHKQHSGYSGSDTVYETIAVQTTDATVTNLWTKTLSNNTTYLMEISVVARHQTEAAARGAGGKLKFVVYRNNAGDATIATDSGGRVKEIETYGTSGYDFDVDVSTNDVRIRVTGAASQTVAWVGNIKYMAVSTHG